MAVLAVFTLLAGCASTARYPVSDHYDGSRFLTNADHTFGEEVKWFWEMETVEWPDWVTDPRLPPPPPHVSGTIRATYVNHATVLLQLNGVNVLTDPIWSDRAGPLSWLGTPRVRAPAVPMQELPRIDVILISHDHYDHLDLPTLRKLAERDRPVVITGLGNAELLREAGFSDVRERDWWECDAIGGLAIHFVPAAHLSGRGMFDANASLWGGFVIQGPEGRVYFAGDSAHGPFVDKLAERFRPLDLAILPIGAYEKRWFMQRMHMNPDDAVRTHLALKARQSIGMHFATFLEHPEQAIDAHETDLATALSTHGVAPARFLIPRFGEGIEVQPTTVAPAVVAACAPGDAPAVRPAGL